jgi:hypothetical protein
MLHCGKLKIQDQGSRSRWINLGSRLANWISTTAGVAVSIVSNFEFEMF